MKVDNGKVRELRKKSNILQKDLAAKLDISSTALGKIESGKTKLTVDLIERIAEAIDKPAGYVFDFVEGESSDRLLAEQSALEQKYSILLSDKDSLIDSLQKELEAARKMIQLQEETIETQKKYIGLLNRRLEDKD